ncbi:MAG TPA: hypothetical protein VN867_08430 [Candidatus Binataceae bacterium]|nr:hypothetical protein [Candidatus Binataceae bacterium]
MQIVELLQRGVGLGARVFFGEVFVKWVIENLLAGLGSLSEPLDHRIPRAFHVELHRGKLERGIESGAA